VTFSLNFLKTKNRQMNNTYLENVDVSLTFLLCLGIETKGDDVGDAVVD